MQRRERIGPAPPDRADARRDGRRGARASSRPKRGIVHAPAAPRDRGAVGPDEGARHAGRRPCRSCRARQRQLREGPVRQELLERDVAVRLLMREGADHADLVVVERAAGMPACAAQRAIAALGADDQAGVDDLPRSTGAPPRRRRRARPRPGGGEDVQVRAAPAGGRSARRAAPAPPPSSRRARRPTSARVEIRRERGGAARPGRPSATRMRVDRAGRARQAVPDAGGLQQALGGQRDGIGAAVEFRQLHRRQRRGVDHRRAARPAAARVAASVAPTGPAPMMQAATSRHRHAVMSHAAI